LVRQFRAHPCEYIADFVSRNLEALAAQCPSAERMREFEMTDEFVAWPFPVLKPEADWDEFDREFLDFMRTAYAEAYRPRHQHEIEVEADSPAGRSVLLVFRGRRNGWEPFLGESGQSVRLGPSYCLPLGECACVCVRPPFRAAAHLALDWLRGRSLGALLGDFVFVGGHPAGIELRQEVISV
jgi:hypothetical protein